MWDCYNKTCRLGVEPMNCLALGHSLHLPQPLPLCVGALQEGGRKHYKNIQILGHCGNHITHHVLCVCVCVCARARARVCVHS
jgi:hypothetical protein